MTLFLLAALLVPSFAVASTAPSFPQASEGRQTDEAVPFDLVENIIIARGTINGSPATWIVDTGSNQTIVTPKAARAAKIEGGETGIARVAAGKREAAELRVTIADPDVAHFVRRSGVDYSGIIGTTYLAQFHVVIDYPSRKLSLLDPDAEPPAGTAVPFEFKQGLIFVEAMVNARAPMRLLFDTGAQATLIRPSSAARAGLVGRTIDGRSDVEVARLESLRVGEQMVRGLDVALHEPSQAPSMEKAGLAFDGFLGCNFLARYRVAIDYRGKVLRMREPAVPPPPRKPEAAVPPAPVPAVDEAPKARPPLGLDLRDARVVSVDRGSAASKAGFEADDVIVSIGGQPVRYIEEIRAILGGAKAGSTLTFVVKRAKETVTLKLEW